MATARLVPPFETRPCGPLLRVRSSFCSCIAARHGRLAPAVDCRQYTISTGREATMASKSSEAMVSNEMGDLDGDSLVIHRTGRPGKIRVVTTKHLVPHPRLAPRYSPCVAAPV